MSNLTVLNRGSDVKEKIEDFLKKYESFDGVMLIGLNKDGTTYMSTSTMSGMEKTYLAAFAQAYIASLFEDIMVDLK